MNTIDTVNRSLQGPIRLPEEAMPVLDPEELIQAGQAPTLAAPRSVRLAPTTVPVSIAAPPQPDVKTLADRYTAAIDAKGRAEIKIEAAQSALATAMADADRAAEQAESLRVELVKMLAK